MAQFARPSGRDATELGVPGRLVLPLLGHGSRIVPRLAGRVQRGRNIHVTPPKVDGGVGRLRGAAVAELAVDSSVLCVARAVGFAGGDRRAGRSGRRHAGDFRPVSLAGGVGVLAVFGVAGICDIFEWRALVFESDVMRIVVRIRIIVSLCTNGKFDNVDRIKFAMLIHMNINLVWLPMNHVCISNSSTYDNCPFESCHNLNYCGRAFQSCQ